MGGSVAEFRRRIVTAAPTGHRQPASSRGRSNQSIATPAGSRSGRPGACVSSTMTGVIRLPLLLARNRRKHGSPPRLRGLGLAAAASIGLSGLLGGCSGNGDDTIVIARQNSDGTVTTQRIPRELSPREGQKLLREISQNPKRLEKLTPPEKRFLARAAAAKANREDEKDAGR